MCVISLKKPQVAFESDEDFSQCFKRNPDGTGFMWYRDGLVHWSKGFMTLEAALAEYKRIQGFLTVDDWLAIHHRIGTSGGKTPAMTHPFAVGDKETITATNGTTRLALCHNGILSNMKTEADMSDTAVLVRDYLTPMWKDKLNYETRGNILNQLKGSSKLLTFDADHGVMWFGDWQTEPNGLVYSNLLWKPTPATSYRHGYDYDDWGGYGYGARGNAQTPATTSGTGKGARKAAKARPTSEVNEIEFDTYSLNEKEVQRLVKLNHPVIINRYKVDPNEKLWEDLYVLDGLQCYQLFDSDKHEYFYIGELDYPGQNFKNAEEFLVYMRKFELLGVGA